MLGEVGWREVLGVEEYLTPLILLLDHVDLQLDRVGACENGHGHHHVSIGFQIYPIYAFYWAFS